MTEELKKEKTITEEREVESQAQLSDKEADLSHTDASVSPEIIDVEDTDKPVVAPEDDLDQYPHGAQLIILSAAALVATFLIALDQTIVGTAIPKITDEFKSLSDVAWYASAYFMTFGGMSTSAGKLCKYFDIKWVFLASMVVFEVGSLICGVAPNSNTLIVGRAIAGVGGAGLGTSSMTIISMVVPPARRPLMVGILSAVYCVAAVMGPLVGGAFTDGVSWRWCFYINLPIGGVAAVGVVFFFRLPDSIKPPPTPLREKLLHTDPVGVALAMGGITSLLLALQYGGNTHPWDSSEVIGLLVGFVAIMVTLVAWELWLGDYAMLLPRLYRKRSVSAVAPFQFFFMGSYVVLLYYLPIYFQSIKGVSPIRSAVNNLPLMVPAAVFALLGGIVVLKTGRAQQVMMVSSGLSTVAIGLLYTFDLDTNVARWAGLQFFIGAAMSFGIMHGLLVAQADVGPTDIAAVTANINWFQTIGGAFSSAAGQAAFLNEIIATLPEKAPGVNPEVVLGVGASQLHQVFPPDILPGVLQSYMTGIRGAFAVSLAFSGVAFLISFLIPFKKLPTHEPGKAPAMVV